MVAWLVFSASATGASCPATGGSAADCSSYVGVAAAIVLVIWLAGVVPLSIIWYATRATVGTGEARWGDLSDARSDGPIGAPDTRAANDATPPAPDRPGSASVPRFRR